VEKAHVIYQETADHVGQLRTVSSESWTLFPIDPASFIPLVSVDQDILCNDAERRRIFVNEHVINVPKTMSNRNTFVYSFSKNIYKTGIFISKGFLLSHKDEIFDTNYES
jgi:hypothetical protein